MTIKTIDPNTNKTVKSFKEMTDKYIESAVAQAQVAYHSWKDTLSIAPIYYTKWPP